MARALLITGATCNHGGAVINALLAKNTKEFTILAVTWNTQSAGAKRLVSKSPSIKLLEGNLDSVPTLVSSAKSLAGSTPLWGVYSVQVSMGKGTTLDGELRQGKAIISPVTLKYTCCYIYVNLYEVNPQKLGRRQVLKLSIVNTHCLLGYPLTS
jgi:hypothetical protein